MRTRNEDKVQLVKQKAMEMAVAEGLEGFSVNKLARACGISVATLYIYYKDKEDLITRIAIEEGQRMTETTFKDFDADMPFAEGLRLQWRNRARYMMDNPAATQFFEQLRSSSYQQKFMQSVTEGFKETLEKFAANAVARGEIKPMPLEVYWSIAFAPLYSLLRFHNEGRSIGGRPFVMNEEILWQTFDRTLIALTA